MGEVKVENKEEFFSIPKAAKRCGVSRATMWNWVKSGKVDAFVTPGGHNRIRREEMDRLLAENGFSGESRSTVKRILVVDDDPKVRKLFELRLERQGFEVVSAKNGFEAGVILSEKKPDLVLLDLFMEGIDGFEVCRTIKTDSNLEKIKILAISGAVGEAIEQDDDVLAFTPAGALLRIVVRRGRESRLTQVLEGAGAAIRRTAPTFEDLFLSRVRERRQADGEAGA